MAIEILTGFLVFLTGYYAVVTHKILKANEKAVEAVNEQNESLSRPYVHVALRILSDSPIYVLTIRNNGKTTAKNLRMSIDREFYAFKDRGEKLNELPAFNQNVDSFPPQAEFNFWLGTAADIHNRKNDNGEEAEGFVVNVEYEFSDKKVSESTTVDFRPFLLSDLPRHDVAHAINKLEKSVSEIKKKI